MTELSIKTVRLAGNFQSDSIVDGDGLRSVIWFQGCPHKCLGCHNPDSQKFDGGKLVLIEEVIKSLQNLTFQDGITFSGGEPFAQPEALAIIAKEAKRLEFNTWAYTGYTFEQLLTLSENQPAVLEALKAIDILVDGKFDIGQKSLNLKFRGSKNQRIINVKNSLKQGRVVQIQKYRKTKEFVSYQEKFV